MSCPARRMDGSGYRKSEDPTLEVRNNCDLAALMAAREAQDATFQSAWTGGESTATNTSISQSELPPPVHTVPLSETCFEVDGHIYKIPDPNRAQEIEKSLEKLAAEREKEEAKWAAYWKEKEAAVPPKPAWEESDEVVRERVSEPLDLGTELAETKTDAEKTNTDCPQIDVSELA